MSEQMPYIPDQQPTQSTQPLRYMDGASAPQYAANAPQEQPYAPYGPYGAEPYRQPRTHKLRWLATLGMILSIVGLSAAVFWPLWYLWLSCSLGGLVCAIIAKAKKVPSGKATAALVCGIIGLVLNLMIVTATADSLFPSSPVFPYNTEEHTYQM